MTYSLGIDLGTTYSAAAVARDGRVEVVSLGDRAPAIPSVVLLREDGTVLVGDAAERRAVGEPHRAAREFKRRLGDPTPLILGGTPYAAEALSGRLLKGIFERVVAQEGGAPASTVVTHPANYGPYKRDLLRDAARQAELGSVSFLTEPEAAAVHYSSRERLETGEVVAVYDLGGGTFDAAVLRRTADGFEFLGTPEGIDRLGGLDFDEAVLAHVLASVGPQLGALDPDDPATLAAVVRLRDASRDAKEGLSNDSDATIPVLLPSGHTDVRITRREFEAMIEPRLADTVASLRRAVASTGLSFDDVDRILLVGGSSRIPLVGELLRELTGRPIAVDAHPKFAIATGAAMVAAARAAAAAAPIVAAPPPPAPPPAPEPPAPEPPAPEPPVAVAPTLPVAVTPPVEALVPPPPGPPLEPMPAGAPPEGGGGGRGWLLGVAAAAAIAVVVAIVLLTGGDGDGVATGDTTTTTAGPTTTAEASTTTADSASTTQTTEDGPTTTAEPAVVGVDDCPVDPELHHACITSVEASGDDLVVFYTTDFAPNLLLLGEDGGLAPETQHIHFFFDTTAPEDAGEPRAEGAAWRIWATPSPYTGPERNGGQAGYTFADIPPGARRICSLVASNAHVVTQATGNCADLPDRG